MSPHALVVISHSLMHITIELSFLLEFGILHGNGFARDGGCGTSPVMMGRSTYQCSFVAHHLLWFSPILHVRLLRTWWGMGERHWLWWVSPHSLSLSHVVWYRGTNLIICSDNLILYFTFTLRYFALYKYNHKFYYHNIFFHVTLPHSRGAYKVTYVSYCAHSFTLCLFML